MKSALSFAVIFLTFSAFASVAHAAAITNLADEPRTIEVNDGHGYNPLTIAAGQTYRIPGDLDVRVNGRREYIYYDENYALWKNGDFGPQSATVSHYGSRP